MEQSTIEQTAAEVRQTMFDSAKWHEENCAMPAQVTNGKGHWHEKGESPANNK